mmetsp:Transcript_37408/g.117825  ORF Transcript_37408/g.117825 Transcript_37408/m.117825 type:complete len:204 (+) Transcript_37408:1710-2321(+)
MRCLRGFLCLVVLNNCLSALVALIQAGDLVRSMPPRALGDCPRNNAGLRGNWHEHSPGGRRADESHARVHGSPARSALALGAPSRGWGRDFVGRQGIHLARASELFPLPFGREGRELHSGLLRHPPLLRCLHLLKGRLLGPQEGGVHGCLHAALLLVLDADEVVPGRVGNHVFEVRRHLDPPHEPERNSLADSVVLVSELYCN